MSTRARIGLENADGSVTSIYSHWEGYPESAGAILLDSYRDADKLRELLALGDVSSLGNEIGEAHDFETHSKNPAATEWTLFYGRDRGEEGVDAVTHPADKWPDSGQEYEYVLRAGGWFVHALWDPRYAEWSKLTPAVCAETFQS